ncbi:hypothetical protein ACF0H5_003329 [Mactra antiquata]
MEFIIYHHPSYKTTSIYIKGGNIKLDKDCKLIDECETEYNYNKLTYILSNDKIDEINEIENTINTFLDEHGYDPITLVYDANG